MEDDTFKIIQRAIIALERIADGLEEHNRLQQEDIEILNGIDLNDIEFTGRAN